MKSQGLDFYRLIGAPVPLRSEFFLYQQTSEKNILPLNAFRSRTQTPNDQIMLASYWIETFQWIWKYIFGIISVFICDAYTFNIAKKNTPIRFFVITQSAHVWTVKGIVSLLFSLINMFFRYRKIEVQFHLHILVDEEHQDFSHQLLPKSDPYLVYRIAHLVPVYHASLERVDQFYEKNHWVTMYLPHFLLKQTIFLPFECALGKTRIKEKGDTLFGSFFGRTIGKIFGSVFVFLNRIKQGKKNMREQKKTLGMIFFSENERKRLRLQREINKKK